MMIENLIKTAFRNIYKNKVLALINILGLSIGISATIIIGAVIFYENSYNESIKDGDRIYRIVTKTTTSDGEFYNRGVPVPLQNSIEEVSPEIEKSTQFFVINQHRVENKVTNLSFDYPDKIIYADPSYFELFEYKWLAGNPLESLFNPNEVVLTSDRAKRYFPEMSAKDIVGKILIYNDSVPMTVVGVVSDLNRPTDFYFQEFISKKSSSHFGQEEIVENSNRFSPSSSTQLFVKKKEKGSIEGIIESLAAISKDHTNPESTAIGQKNDFWAQPLTDLHFNSKYGIFDDSEYQGNRNLLTGLFIVATFLMLLSIINYVNLNTAQGLSRSKEIGIRKALGSSRKQLIFQFLGETLLLNIFATILSILFSLLLLRIFSDFLPTDQFSTVFTTYHFFFFVVLIVIFLTLLSGFYPAFILSKFQPESVLRGKWSAGRNKTIFRKSLSVFQFGIAQLFIIISLMIGRQIYFLINQDVGFRTKAVVSLEIGKVENIDNHAAFIEELKNIRGVELVSLGGGTPFQAMMAYPMVFKDKGKEIINHAIKLEGDIEYRNLFEIELIAGRDRLNDTINEYIINETFLRSLGLTEPYDVIGKSLYLKTEKKSVSIVGVMKDFYTAPLHYKVEPTVLTGSNYQNYRSLILTLGGTSANWPVIIERIEGMWKQRFPNLEFNPRFVDDTIQAFYIQERNLSFLLKWATGLAVLISLMGLWSLTIYTLETKKKEIGIRKILGASLFELNVLLTRETILLIGIGFILAVPLAYFFLNYWLDGFAYKVSMNWWVFLFGGILMLIIALSLIGFQVYSSARANPIDSLQTE